MFPWTNVSLDNFPLDICPLEKCILDKHFLDLSFLGQLSHVTMHEIVKTTTQPQHNPKTTSKQPNTIQRKLGLTRLLVCTTTTHPKLYFQQ